MRHTAIAVVLSRFSVAVALAFPLTSNPASNLCFRSVLRRRVDQATNSDNNRVNLNLQPSIAQASC